MPWTGSAVSQLGFREGDWLPVGDPAFLGQVWASQESTGGVLRPGEAALFSAASTLRAELGSEVRASLEVLSALALVLEATAEAERTIAAMPGPSTVVALALADCLARLAAHMRTPPNRENRRRELIAQALVPLLRLANPAPCLGRGTLKAA